MIVVSATMVKELREISGAGMMDAKKALVETKGDMEAAQDWLRTKGLLKAEKKSSRVAAEGLVGVSIKNLSGMIVEVNSETDFVATNDEFKSLVEEVNIAWKSLGSSSVKSSLSELTSVSHRRSIYVVSDIKKGDMFTLENLKSIRPGNGLEVKYLENFIGNVSRVSIPKGTPLKWSFLDDDS